MPFAKKMLIFAPPFGCFLLVITTCSVSEKENQPDFYPKVHDPGLQIELITTEPDIVTPIGIAIDEKDALYVLESHTHSPPKDYTGPAFDRIKKGIDGNADGKPDKWVVFADSIENGANLATGPEGRVYLSTKKSIRVYQDKDGDGISDWQQTLLSMPLPEYVYDHAGLLGIALGPNNWVYVSRGNLGGKGWRLEGKDGESIEGYGEGGIVFRFKTDGSQLEKIATGFWNPFDLQFTLDGRLLLTDNDPDSRGPNRLVEIVPGGDYGFKDLYGGSGLHPYVAWNGELPGTLPYAAALGEAPCALIDAGKTNFGNHYDGSVLVNVWEENSIVRIPLTRHGSTVKGIGQVLVKGDSGFHPVAFATNSRGDLFITDWVVREYPNHGSGRIWRLSSGDGTPGNDRKSTEEKIDRFADKNMAFPELQEMLRTGDAFEQVTARHALTGPASRQDVIKLAASDNASLRLQGLLIFLKSEYEIDKNLLEKLLTDPEIDIRRMAMMYTGTKMRTGMWEALQQALAGGFIGPDLFETYLATLHHLQPEFIDNYTSQSGKSADKQEQKLPAQYLETLIGNGSLSEEIRALALPYLENTREKQELLLGLLKGAETDQFRIGLMKSLKTVPSDQVAQEILAIAQSHRVSEALRAQAVLLLSYQGGNYCREVKELLSAQQELVRQTALKYLCRCSGNAQLRDEVDIQLTSRADTDMNDSWNMCTGRGKERPTTNEEWAELADGSGNARRGQLVFESASAMCQTCHQVNGWGSSFGPDLSHVGNSKSREQLITAILAPSLEISPEWQGWYVVDQQGVRHTGRQIDVNLNFIELLNLEGSFDRFENPQSFGVLEQSLMPASLQNTITPAEFNDLIAYLESLK